MVLVGAGLLREYYFWANAQNGDVARALKAATYDVLGSTERGEELGGFLKDYASYPGRALSAMKEIGERNWQAWPERSAHSAPVLAAAAESAMPSKPDDTSEHMEVDSGGSSGEAEAQADAALQATSDVVDTAHIMHPDEVVFLSQLDPVPDAEVVSRCRVQDAELLENSALLYNYQGLIDDLNCKSASMYKWMLHAQEQPLYDIVGRSGKLVSTRDWDTVRSELIRVRVLERIEDLKEKKKWSFWQLHRHRAPPRSKAHWDHTLAEMEWMHADFVEERKLRIAMAQLVSSWVMDYHQAIDKSRYTVTARRRLLPDQFIHRATAHLSGEQSDAALRSPGACAVEPTLGETDLLLGKGRTSLPEAQPESAASHASAGAGADALVASAVSSGLDRVAVDGGAGTMAAEDTSKALEVAGGGPLKQMAAMPRTGSDAGPADDRAVPSCTAMFEGALSVFHVLAQLPASNELEDILGDSVHALQALSALVPYAPAWDVPYCDVLDASPVVPICRSMWPDFAIEDACDDESSAGPLDSADDTIDIHELLRLGADCVGSALGTESEGHGVRSIFTRSVMAPSMLPMFTQANRQLRVSHSSAGQPPADTPAQQAISEACPGQAVFEWSAERDRVLAKIVQQYVGNWPLIAESFNHALALYGSRAMGSRVCFERWAAIKDEYALDRATVQTGFDEPDFGPRKQQSWASHLSVQPAAAQLSAMQLATHVVAHSEAFKAVSESKQKRDSAPVPAPVPPREIRPLAADQKVPTPAELSKLKAENDRRLQQMFHEQRQATAAAAALAMQQQRALHPHLQVQNIGRQIEVLQAMLASGPPAN
ncbi:chromatin modification- protein VID21 [Coemansia biformis]|uniref:Vacuolar import and degradation protein 21 n=1 Tax=Coemansia biformis TaxID=1286918 RepID=A0A9W7YBJ6_9FUNG|nr:chromatin modification- protein VID21 [Coemansia biformis]